MLESWPEKSELAREILLAEQEGDRITHDIIQRLYSTFVTPIDREDILALASGLDDILDFTEEVADFLGLYRIEAPMDQAIELAKVLHGAARQIQLALPRLRTLQDLSHYVVEIHRLENDGDRLERMALASLFERAVDPMMVIRWKDIFERLENAVDATEQVANTLQGIVLKNS
jgi:predicted phosphate transport protein (TIGR00153 family)